MALRLSCRKNTAYLITDKVNRTRFSGVNIDEGILVIGDETAYFLDARYFAEYVEILIAKNVTPILYRDEKDLTSYFEKSGIKTVYIDFDLVTVSEYKKYKSLGVKIKDGGDKIKKARSVKSGNELKNIKKSCSIIERAVKKAIDNLSVGKTELEIAKEIETEVLKLGGEGLSFDTIVAFGKNSAVPHHVPCDIALEKNTVVLIDAGAVYNGYASDITRTVFFGSPTEEFIKVYEVVLTANEKVIAKARAGMTYKEIDAIARDYLHSEGYGEYFTHSLGHGLGLEIHEYPRVSPKADGKMANGTVFTVEPGVYLDGQFGVRIEDTVVMKNGKIQRLFTDGKAHLVK